MIGYAPFLGQGRLRKGSPDRTIGLGQAATPPAGAAKAYTDQNFSEVLAAPRAIAMFYSPNCPRSRAFMPIFQGQAGQSPDVLFATVNVDENIQNAGKYKVSLLPTLVFFVNGQEIGRIDGAQEQSDLTAEMAKAFAGGATPAQAAAQASATRAGTESVATAPSNTPIYVAGALGVGLLGAIGYIIFAK